LINGDFLDILRALANPNRRNMVQILLKKETHIAALARELNISNPVALKHARILEENGLIEREKVGNTHILHIRKDALKKIRLASELFEKPISFSVAKGTLLLDALSKVEGLEIENTKQGAFIKAVDGKEGYFVFEINGKFPTKPIEEIEISGRTEIELKRLLPVIGKKIVFETAGK